MKIIAIFSALSLVALLLGQGCQSAQSQGQGRQASKEPAIITQGMSVEEVRSLLGEPDRIYPFENDQVEADVWVYRRTKDSSVRMVQTGTQELPYWDPITGVYRPINDPILRPEVSKVTEITEFLIIDGEVVSWRRKHEQDRDMMR